MSLDRKRRAYEQKLWDDAHPRPTYGGYRRNNAKDSEADDDDFSRYFRGKTERAEGTIGFRYDVLSHFFPGCFPFRLV